jgi:sugar/nucleoside kinase (ribokinase family)
MSLLVTGSIAIDSIETPLGRATDILGGSAIYFSLAASLFTDVRIVGVVGEDFDMQYLTPLADRRIDTRGVEVRKGSKTFRWTGRYTGAMNEAETLDVKLNVLAERGAPVPDCFADSGIVFLANTHPALQRELAERFCDAKLRVCDTMNLWIQNEPAELRKTLACVDGLVLNEGEARLLTGKSNLVTAGREILKLGPRFTAIKKGEHGSLFIARDDLFIMPPYPTENVVDPTGCGDSFAGGMLGYLAAQQRITKDTLRSAVAHGSIVASFVIESFSVEALGRVTRADVDTRMRELREMVRFE